MNEVDSTHSSLLELVEDIGFFIVKLMKCLGNLPSFSVLIVVTVENA